MTIAEIKAYLSENEADENVKALLSEFAPARELTGDYVVSYLETDDGFRVAKPLFDRYAGKAIQTHDEKRAPEVQRMVEEATAKAKRESEMTAQERTEKAIADLNAKIAASEQALYREKMLSEIRAEAESKGVPVDLAVDLTNPSMTLDYAKQRIDNFVKAKEAEIASGINDRLKGAHRPGSGNEPAGAIDVKKLSFEEMVAREEKGELNDLLTQ